MSESTEQKPVCGNCVAFRKAVKKSVGECHRHPPMDRLGWPSVKPDDWCMDHEFLAPDPEFYTKKIFGTAG